MVDTKHEMALSAVPRYWVLKLMFLPSIKYDLTILRIMTLILLKTIHTLHHKKNRKINIDGASLVFLIR